MAFTLKEIVYDVREKLKVLMSDDSKITDEYLIHLCNVKRAFLLKQKYSDIRKYIPDNLKQSICVNLELSPVINGLECAEKILRSKDTIPELINFNGVLGMTKVMSHDLTAIPFNIITMDRLPYVGYNRFLAKQIYCVIGPDKYLYIKSKDIQYKLLRYIKIIGLFSNPEEAALLSCDATIQCDDILDLPYAIEDSLIQPLVGMIVQELASTMSIPVTTDNDSKDDTITTKGT